MRLVDAFQHAHNAHEPQFDHEILLVRTFDFHSRIERHYKYPDAHILPSFHETIFV